MVTLSATDIEGRLSFIERVLHRQFGNKWTCCDCDKSWLEEQTEPGGHYSWYQGRNNPMGQKYICKKCLSRREAEIASFKCGQKVGIGIPCVEPEKGGSDE